MTPNIGTTDRVARGLIGLVLIVAPLLNLPAIWSSDFWAYGAIAVGAVLVVTAVVRMCPLYRLIGVDTCGI
ncbi:YgaP family membrane protein [Jannaschia donghaensis]|uniref:Inner membrane protein YgaP-like transmembrane domain-containing protein n=1 Tax=Jannaschia donghaensis TaxID=420998 RepID=A0A0M6YM53_9RHOB|nr:DUF2892 domain-containing protein [Jannaschia donghaensis]CTQ50347.1 hypothetical protein JDO7802_02370 [Jannaschia donghaensis]